MRIAITDPINALALLFAGVAFALLLSLAALPRPIAGEPIDETSFSKLMRGESNGETGRDYPLDLDRQNI